MTAKAEVILTDLGPQSLHGETVEFVTLPIGGTVNAGSLKAVVALTEEGAGKAGVLLAGDISPNNFAPVWLCQDSQEVYKIRDEILGKIDRTNGHAVPRTIHGDYVNRAALDAVVVNTPPKFTRSLDVETEDVQRKMTSDLSTQAEPVKITPWEPKPSVNIAWNNEGRGWGPNMNLTTDTVEQATWIHDRLVAPLVAEDSIAKQMGV